MYSDRNDDTISIVTKVVIKDSLALDVCTAHLNINIH